MAQYEAGKRTREEIIEAAGELAAERGLDNFTTRQVAERASVNIGSIHYHFGGKDGLLEALVEDLTREWVEYPLSAVVEAYEGDVSTREGARGLLRAVVERHTTFFRTKVPSNWRNRVMYQVMQHKGSLTDMFDANMLQPTMDTLSKVFSLLQPGYSPYEFMFFISQLLGPLTFHCDYAEVVLEELGETSFSESYMSGLTEMIIDSLMTMINVEEKNENQRSSKQ